MARSSKRSIKYQVSFSEEIDDKITKISNVMGLSKNEFVRYCVAQGIYGYDTSQNVLRDIANKQTV